MEKKVLIFLILAIIPAVINGFDISVFRNELTINVFTTYKNSVGMFASDILNGLARAPIPVDNTSAVALGTILSRNFSIFTSQLQLVENNTEIALVHLDRELENLMGQHSLIDHELNNTEEQVQTIADQLQSTDIEITENERQLEMTNVDLTNAENVIVAAEIQQNSSGNCYNVQGVGDWFDKMQNGSCHWVIQTAKHIKDKAKQQQTHLINVITYLNNVKFQLSAGKRQLEENSVQILAKKQLVQNQISTANDLQNGTLEIFDDKLSGITAYLSMLPGKSVDLKDAISKLINMENLLNPVYMAANQIVQYTRDSVDIGYIDQMNVILLDSANVLKEKLPQYPSFFIDFNTAPSQ